MKPILRWAGSKRWLADQLKGEIEATRPTLFVEPFLGAGSVALAVDAKIPKLLSDGSSALMNVWSMVQLQPEALAHAARRVFDKHGNTKEGYYAVREAYNATAHYGLTSAAQFIYLNKTSFNGLYRENRAGAMNVPFGDVTAPAMPSVADLRAIQNHLRGATLRSGDFREVLLDVPAGAATYIDPPYDDGYVGYIAGGFTQQDQRDLAGMLRVLDDKGVNVWANNADTAFVRDIYGWADLEEVHESRAIAADGDKRKRAACLMIRSRRLG